MTQPLGSNARSQLQSFAERIQRLEEEKKALLGDIADTYEEAKSTGLNPKALKRAIKELSLEGDKRQLTLAFEWEVDAYRDALGIPTMAQMLADSAAERIRS
jgi:uncharacterized protein (UPF0335 family)